MSVKESASLCPLPKTSKGRVAVQVDLSLPLAPTIELCYSEWSVHTNALTGLGSHTDRAAFVHCSAEVTCQSLLCLFLPSGGGWMLLGWVVEFKGSNLLCPRRHVRPSPWPSSLQWSAMVSNGNCEREREWKEEDHVQMCRQVDTSLQIKGNPIY